MTAQIIPFTKPEPVQHQHFCSFCMRMEYSVKSLIKSGLNDHCICSDCIRHAKQRLASETTGGAA